MIEFLIAAAVVFGLCWVWVGGYVADFVVWLISTLTPNSSNETNVAYVVSGAALVFGIVVAMATSGNAGSSLGGAVAGAGLYVAARLPSRIRRNRDAAEVKAASDYLPTRPAAAQSTAPPPPAAARSTAAHQAAPPVATPQVAYITAVRTNRPTADDHECVTDVLWQRPGGETKTCSLQAMVEFIDQGNAVYAGPAGANVGVIRAMPPHLRAYSDGEWTGDLLSLPRF